MKFYDFMQENFLESATPEGDLAYDMQGDTFFKDFKESGSREADYRAICQHLKKNHACTEALHALHNAWKIYCFN